MFKCKSDMWILGEKNVDSSLENVKWTAGFPNGRRIQVIES